MLYYVISYCTVLYIIDILFYNILHYFALYHTLLTYTYLSTYLPTYLPIYLSIYIFTHCPIIYYITLHYTVLYYLVLLYICIYIHTYMHTYRSDLSQPLAHCRIELLFSFGMSGVLHFRRLVGLDSMQVAGAKGKRTSSATLLNELMSFAAVAGITMCPANDKP